MSKNLEFLLRDYFTDNNGKNLSLIKKGLILIEPEYAFPGGRIDILAEYKKRPVAIELKANNYSTQMVGAQLLNYLNFVSDKKGMVMFLAPKVKMGVYSTLKNYYHKDLLELYEFKVRRKNIDVIKRMPRDLDDSRQIKFLNDLCDENSNQKSFYDFLLKMSNKKRYSEKARMLVECMVNPTANNILHAYFSLKSEKNGFMNFLKENML